MTTLRRLKRRLARIGLVRRVRQMLVGAGTTASSPVGNTYFGEKAEKYLAGRTSQEYWQLEQDVLQNILDRFGDSISVLDVPFGTGRFVQYYLQKRMQVFGLDASRDMLAIASRELGVQASCCDLKVGTADRLPYEDGAFDLVVCFRFLSHVVSFESAKAALKEFRRVTRSHAILQFRVRRDDVPPVPSPSASEAMNDRLTLADIRTVIEQSRFTIDDVVPLEQRETYARAVFICRPASTN